MTRILGLLIVGMSLVSCATGSKDIAPVYVSPMVYKDYTCEQLASENQRITTRITEVGGRLDQASANDKAITGVGAIVFWPALFFLGGTKEKEAEFARLKGEYDAVNQASVTKNCDTRQPASGGKDLKDAGNHTNNDAEDTK